MPTKYILHIQNPFNMDEFDDLEADQPWGSFSRGDKLRPRTFIFGRDEAFIVKNATGDVPILDIRRQIGKVGDTWYDETWLITDQGWMDHHP